MKLTKEALREMIKEELLVEGKSEAQLRSAIVASTVVIGNYGKTFKKSGRSLDLLSDQMQHLTNLLTEYDDNAWDDKWLKGLK